MWFSADSWTSSLSSGDSLTSTSSAAVEATTNASTSSRVRFDVVQPHHWSSPAYWLDERIRLARTHGLFRRRRWPKSSWPGVVRLSPFGVSTRCCVVYTIFFFFFKLKMNKFEIFGWLLMKLLIYNKLAFWEWINEAFSTLQNYYRNKKWIIFKLGKAICILKQRAHIVKCYKY